jgi:predicted acylesterase/phospholipase RssA
LTDQGFAVNVAVVGIGYRTATEFQASRLGRGVDIMSPLNNDYGTAIVLQGGGALGAYELGVLEAFTNSGPVSNRRS